MSHANENDAEAKVWKLMKDVSVCMLATKTGDAMRSRPVAAFVKREENAIYVMTDVSGRKDDEIEADPQVLLAFSDPSANSYVSLGGHATVTNDRAKIKELWNVFAKTWWDGPEDPNIRLLKIQPLNAEYWDSPGRLVAGAIMAFNALTGGKGDPGENRKVAM